MSTDGSSKRSTSTKRAARPKATERPRARREGTRRGDAADRAAAQADELDGAEASDVDAVDAELVSEAELAEAAFSAPVGPRGLSPGRATPLAKYDPLQAYMRDVQQYKLLTPAEEHEAALAYYEHGDVTAAAKLITANLRLVVKIAYEYRRAHKHLQDIIQEGSIGLMQAVKKYDPYKGVKLSTYAAWWIRAYILRFVLNNARLVKLGTTQAQRKLFFNLKKERARLSAMGIEPTPETIAERLNVPEIEVVNMERRLASGDMSLDAPARAGEQSSSSRIEQLSDLGRDFDDDLADQEVSAMVQAKMHEFGATLAGKDARIYHSRMLAEDPLTLQQLGEEFGVSRERVRQLERRIQLRLKDYLDAQLGKGVIGD